MNYLDKYNNMKLAFNNKVFINILYYQICGILLYYINY